ncbi:MAG TPA: Fur family transcriptional regulator [Dissulfurispiraceae bacterium]|nr:Fur family transcriptional regulator [Dissulfurispiraceae bacterium]HMK49888.1 Fur family transcriptional regulator [Thermodesulfovibrionales bacterium]
MKLTDKARKIEQGILDRLREKGYKLTLQRREIISILAQDSSHPRAADILLKARKRAPRISVSTVYYTLAMLKKEDLIREIEFYDMDNRYDINVSNHLNLICEKCGRIEDYVNELPLSSLDIEQRSNFQPFRFRLECYGVCSKCRKSKK